MERQLPTCHVSPCKKCIVTVMCQDPCDEAMKHFKIMIENFKPDRPAQIRSKFLYDMLLKVKVEHRSGVAIVINYLDGHKDVDCYDLTLLWRPIALWKMSKR